MKKVKIIAIVLGASLVLLFIIQLNLEVSYKDEVDLMQTAIAVSKDIPNKEKAIQISKTQQLGKEIINELNIVKILILVTIVFLLAVVFLYIRLYINRNKPYNQSSIR
jgi:Na+/H+ antiporter NhaC